MISSVYHQVCIYGIIFKGGCSFLAQMVNLCPFLLLVPLLSGHRCGHAHCRTSSAPGNLTRDPSLLEVFASSPPSAQMSQVCWV